MLQIHCLAGLLSRVTADRKQMPGLTVFGGTCLCPEAKQGKLTYCCRTKGWDVGQGKFFVSQIAGFTLVMELLEY